MNDLPDRIQRLRRELRLTQQALGKIAGVSKSAVSQWERGITEPQRDALLSMQRNAGISPAWIMQGSGGMRQPGEGAEGFAGGAAAEPRGGPLAVEERELLACYRAATTAGKEIIRSVAGIVAGHSVLAEQRRYPKDCRCSGEGRENGESPSG